MYQLPKLPYLFQDLEPYIDTHTMGLHYHKHEKNYLNKLNSILIKDNYNFQYPLEELIFHINEFPSIDQQDILFNLGGVINHNLYWKSMNPNPKLPYGKLQEQIVKQYKSIDLFLKTFKDTALALKGSGYTFLVTDSSNNLQIMNLKNQETPLTLGYIPLFNIDMWEHAYYLNYKNEKEQYINNFLTIADFTNASRIYQNYSNKI